MENTSNYKKYKSKNPLKRIIVSRFKKKISKFLLEYNDKDSLLDVGCGEGFVADYIYHNTKIKNIVGIDNSDIALSYAKKNNPNITYKNMDICDLKEKSKYDLVICLEVLEHMKNPEVIVKNLCDCARKKIIISVPHEPFFSLGNLVFLKNVKRLGVPEEHINIWTKKKFKKFLMDNGIQNFRIHTTMFWIIIEVYK